MGPARRKVKFSGPAGHEILPGPVIYCSVARQSPGSAQGWCTRTGAPEGRIYTRSAQSHCSASSQPRRYEPSLRSMALFRPLRVQAVSQRTRPGVRPSSA